MHFMQVEHLKYKYYKSRFKPSEIFCFIYVILFKKEENKTMNENQIITYESVKKRLQDKPLDQYTRQDVIDRYVAYGTQEELSKPEIQQLFVKHQLYDELICSVDSVIEDKMVIQNLLKSDIFDELDISIIDGKIIDIVDKSVEDSNSELKYTMVLFKETSTSKLYEINIAVFFHLQGFEEYRTRLQSYYDNELIAIVTKNEKDKFQIKCFLKKYKDIDYFIQ